MKEIIFIGVIVIFAIIVFIADADSNEYTYTKIWCDAHNGNSGGKNGVRMTDGSLADCITESHGIEVDFCEAWAACIGQSLHYANLTNKKPMCVLICNPKTKQRYIDRFNNALKYINRYEKPELVIIPE